MHKPIPFPRPDRNRSDPYAPDTNPIAPEQLKLMQLLSCKREALVGATNNWEALWASLRLNDSDATLHPAHVDIGG